MGASCERGVGLAGIHVVHGFELRLVWI